MDLNTILLILVAVILGILVIHGIWSNRQNQSKVFKTESKSPQVTPISVMEKVKEIVESEEKEEKQEEKTVDGMVQTEIVSQSKEESAEISHIRISLRDRDVYSLTIEEIEQNLNSEEGAEIYSTVLRDQLSRLKEKQTAVEQVKNESQKTQSQKEEKQQEKMTAEVIKIEKETEIKEEATPKVLMLYLVAPEKQDFDSETLLPTLEKEGFLLGDKQIFHRHAELSQQSPVLFNLANLENNGIFPEDGTPFRTFGLVLFMELPVNYGTSQTNWCLMLNTAKALAQKLQATLLSDTQIPFNEEIEKQYRQRLENC